MLAKSQHVFLFILGLAREQLPVFLFAASQSKNVLTLEAWLPPTQGAECINFFTLSLCQAAHRSPSQTAKLTASSANLELVPGLVRKTVNIVQESIPA